MEKPSGENCSQCVKHSEAKILFGDFRTDELKIWERMKKRESRKIILQHYLKNV